MTPLLELRAVRYTYAAHACRPEHPRPPALDGVDLQLRAHSRLAILGANGAGKSTLLLHLNGTLRPSSGELFLDGSRFDYSRRGLTTLRQHVGLVLQEPDDQLFAGTVRQDISFGPLNLGLSEAEAAVRVDAALEAMELTALADLPPHQLSQGQRKRAAIAGALAMRPRLLVLDEPTAGLDPRGIDELARQLDLLHARGIAIVLTTHDIDFAHRWAREVAIVQEGRIVVQGAPDPILGDARLMHAAGLRLPIALAIRQALAAETTARPVPDAV